MGTIWILTATIFHMLILVSSFGFLDGGGSGNKNRKGCSCLPHSEATEEYKKDKNIYKYCGHIEITLKCLIRLRAKKNCSIDLYTTALHTGTVWQYRHFNCSYILQQDPSNFTTVSPSSGPNQGGDRKRCVYKRNFVEEETRHCGLFGDPHLKTFSDQRQTCVVKGAWSLLNNEYLAVQVTNVLIERNNPVATATSKIQVVGYLKSKCNDFKSFYLARVLITVLIKKDRRGCAQQKVYQAQIGHVPETFRDGTRHTGPDSCRTTLTMEPGKLGVRINVCYLNTTILIRKVGKYLTFNIRTPEQYVGQSRGLCMTGCPKTEMIDYEGFFNDHPNSVLFGSSSPAMSKSEAIYLCKLANVTDFYYDSCVFDLISTGDRRFSGAAYRAMRDAVNMDPKLRLRRSNSVVLKHMDRSASLPPGGDNTKKDSITSGSNPLYRTLTWVPILSVLTCLLVLR
eukprot:gene10028-11052_t